MEIKPLFKYSFDEITTQWLVDEVPVCFDSFLRDDGTVSCSFLPIEAGELTIALQATNPDGLTAQDTIKISVFENELPDGEIISPTSDGEYFHDTPILFSANVSDDLVSPDNLMVEWESTIEGILGEGSPDANGLFEEMYTLSEGEHQITLQVSENGQLVIEKTIDITVF